MMKKYRRHWVVKIVILVMIFTITMGCIIVKNASANSISVASTESTTDSNTKEESIVDSEDSKATFECTCHKANTGEPDNVLQYEDKVYGVFCSDECPAFQAYRQMHQCNNIIAQNSFNGDIALEDITVYGNMTFEFGQNRNVQENGCYYYAVVGDYNSVKDCLIGEKNKKTIE